MQWHQDAPLWPILNPAQSHSMVSAWIPLDTADVSNGALHMVPGSHLWGDRIDCLRSTHHESDGIRGGLGINQLPGGQVSQPCPVHLGEVHFHHGLSWHHSPVNNSSRRRRALALHYCSGDTPFEAPDGHILFAQLGGEQTERTMAYAGPHFPVVWTHGNPAPIPAAAPPFPVGVLARM